jgi:hypothetical protein
MLMSGGADLMRTQSDPLSLKIVTLPADGARATSAADRK